MKIKLPEYTIIKHIRQRGKPKATLVAWKGAGESYNVGWSMCHSKDNFNKQEATSLALLRGMHYSVSGVGTKKFPYLINEHLPEFINRAGRYFKDMKVPGWVTGKVT